MNKIDIFGRLRTIYGDENTLRLLGTFHPCYSTLVTVFLQRFSWLQIFAKDQRTCVCWLFRQIS